MCLAAASCIDKIRSAYDAQHSRWPAHLNLLYPFFPSLDTEAEDASPIGDMLACLAQLEPFVCRLDAEPRRFSKAASGRNRDELLFLEPSSSSAQQIHAIHRELRQLFAHIQGDPPRWRLQFRPHLTIAQKASAVTSDSSTTTPEEAIRSLLKTCAPVEFTVDCVYWLSRDYADDRTSPFRVRFALPLGARYPAIRCGLDPVELGEGDNLLRFLSTRHMLPRDEEGKKTRAVFALIQQEILHGLEKQWSSLGDGNKNERRLFAFERGGHQAMLGLVPMGSFLMGIKSGEIL